jgi:uncharacterized protein (TIGR03663 family)
VSDFAVPLNDPAAEEAFQDLPVGRQALPGLAVRVTWEVAAYAALVVVGAGLRLWDLGSRALHHDESLHGFYSYELFVGEGYEHNPLLHGPFQFFGTALTFVVAGGAGDHTVRIMPALFGIALIALPYLLRNHLGRSGALFASALIALSPTLLYFSRFARNDIYIAVFTLGLVICLWRYVDERRSGYMLAAAGLLGVSFATKENTFIHLALLLVFLNLWLAADFARQTREALGSARAGAAAYGILYLPWAWAWAALWPLIRPLRERLGLREVHPAGGFLLLLGTLSLPQLSAAVQVPLEAMGVEMDTLAQQQRVGVPVVITLLLATATVGLRWNWRVWLPAAAIFYVVYGLLFTSFGTNGEGFGTGIWDSLDYWIGQHDVRRGDQPDFYYVMLLPAYEYLALAFAGPALLWFSLRGGPRAWLLTALATLSLLAFFGADSFSETAGEIVMPLALPVAAVALWFAVRGSMFERFLVFWTASAIVAYSWVGEKMPWLSVHTTLPVLLLAAYSLGRLIERLPSPSGLHRHPPGAALALAAALGAAAVLAAAFWPGDDGSALRIALLAACGVMFLALLPALGPRRAGLVFAAAVVGGLGLMSVRTAVVATFEHGDVPREMLIYTQTSPDVPDIRDRIERTARESGLGEDLPIIIDSAYTWPWPWYLRDYRVVYKSIDEDFEPPEDAVLLVAAEHSGVLADYFDRYQEPVEYRLRWWFPERYRGIGRDNLWLAARDFGESLGRGGTWESWWRFFRDREPPAELGAVRGVALFPRAYDPAAQPDVEGRLTIGRPGDGEGELTDPAGIALDGDGNIVVADSGNGRVQVFSPEGRLLAIAGSAGNDAGQFNQPGDLALDAEGNIYVVDTWNHRVQKLDRDLNFLLQWGKPAPSLLSPGDDEFWGPRGIAVDVEGNVWVVDTGTDRVRKFTPEGELLATLGEQGDDPGQFSEPVGITFDPLSGDVLIADVGNARIQRFDTSLAFVAEYPVVQWLDVHPANKPDLAALPDGRILAGDPAHNRLLLVSREGGVAASLDAVGGIGLAFPRGIAYDFAGSRVFVTEGTADRVRRFPLSDFAFR